ncbi:MAG: transglycosylase SLT domain-containing protein [Pyrinomonadaceae bacterium]
MLHAKSLRLLIILFAFSLSVFAQNLDETHSKIRAALETHDYQTAIIELQNFGRADNKIFALNNYDYLLARLAEKNNDAATAIANYQTVVNRNSVLSEYALWRLSQIARSSGNLMLERIYLRQLLTTAPNSLLITAANTRMLRSNFESGNFGEVVSGQRSVVSNPNSADSAKQVLQTSQPNDARTRENLVYLGQSYLQLGKMNEAREIFTRLAGNLPNSAQPDDFALAGARGLDELDCGRENLGKIAPDISDGEHYRRALIYQFNRDFSDARLHFTAIIENFPQSNFAPDAMYQTGRGFVQQGNFDEAIKWFERVQAEFPANPIAADALNQMASAYSRVGKPQEAIARYQKAIEKYPNADNAERPFLNIVDIERDAGKPEDALEWIQKTRETFKGKLPEALAVFAQAKIHIAQNDWTNALADLNELQNFSDLGGTRVPGGTNKTEVTFLKGFVLEQLQRYAEAIDIYLSIPDGRAEYYGWRATERLRALANDFKLSEIVLQRFKQLYDFSEHSIPLQNITLQNADSIRQAAQSALRLLVEIENEDPSSDKISKKDILLGTLRQTYSLLPAYQKVPNFKLLEFGRKEVLKEKREITTNYHQTLADELLFLGLYDEGTPELETALTKNGDEQNPKPKTQNLKSNDLAYTLAVFYKHGEMANRAVAFIEPFWKNVPADYQIELIPRDQIELLYPAPYTDSLLKYAAPRNVDPRFVLSIMRQESRYRAAVKSNAAARGLMQFISDTSNRIAAELGRQNFLQDDLYNPPTAIGFGSQYLADLFKQFPNQPAAVAASYNGGEANVARWLARAKSDDPDRYVPEIVFSQSKDYAYKVMANYRVYQTIYNERLNR